MSEQKFTNLPTGKPHISFSELRDWKECSWRHKLKYINKLVEDKPGPLMDFGTACHAACEKFLKSRIMDSSIAKNMLAQLWEKNAAFEGYTPEALPQFFAELDLILSEVPKFMDETFPNWEYVDAEHMLYEQIEGHDHAFKGFIDGVIAVTDAKNKKLIWLLDWKTTSRGWWREKRTDELVKTQLILYKNFWSKKIGVDPKDVRCGFILLKRSAKKEQHCELFALSVGDVTTGRSLKVVNNMLTSIKRGIAIKNRSSCTYCNYFNTPHCV